MYDATELARAHTADAVGKLAEIMNDDVGSKPGEQIAAANALLDRAHGKPSQAVIVVEKKSDVVAELANMTDADLLIALTEARRARRALLPAIEAQVVTNGDSLQCDPLAL